MSKTFSFCALAVLMQALAASALAQDGIVVDAPTGGWREGEAGAAYTQPVNYPAVGVSLRPDQPLSAQIRGRIEGAHKGQGPATLIVDGAAMPLEVDADGHFERPYAFPAGSNSVEIRSPDGQARRRIQFIEANTQRAQARLRVILSWDTPGTDLDLHVVTPSGQHTWYGQRVVPGGAQDVDVTTGYGPEIFSSAAPEKGYYHVYVNYYGSGDPGLLTVARVTLLFNEGLPQERREHFDVPMRSPGELTLVKRFAYP